MSQSSAEVTPPEPSLGGDVPRSVERVLDLLEVVLADRRCTLTAAATATELTPTTARRYLRALEARGYLGRSDSGEFHAGPSLLRIAAAVHEHGPLERLVATAQPRLDALARDTGESAYLVVSDGRDATYVATAESPRAVRHVGWVGQDIPVDGTAAGAAIEAPMTVVSRTGAVEPDITAMSIGLGAVEMLGVALSVVGPTQRFDDDAIADIGAALQAAAALMVDELRPTTEADRAEEAS